MLSYLRHPLVIDRARQGVRLGHHERVGIGICANVAFDATGKNDDYRAQSTTPPSLRTTINSIYPGDKGCLQRVPRYRSRCPFDDVFSRSVPNCRLSAAEISRVGTMDTNKL